MSLNLKELNLFQLHSVLVDVTALIKQKQLQAHNEAVAQIQELAARSGLTAQDFKRFGPRKRRGTCL